MEFNLLIHILDINYKWNSNKDRNKIFELWCEIKWDMFIVYEIKFKWWKKINKKFYKNNKLINVYNR